MSPASTEVETVTLGEVNRNVTRLADQVEALSKAVADYPKWPDIKRIEQQQKEAIEGVALAAKAEVAAVVKVATVQHAAFEERIVALESWVKWAGRTILGSLATGAVALLFVLR